MPPSNAMENDKKRLRNQFTKDERARLLAIMTEYGPLLDDKNISILSRKEIWEIIENKFNENGHSGRTSAQLKKYWQNYKYHSKRTKIIHKEAPKPLSPMTKHMVRMLAKVNPEDWAQYDVTVNADSVKKSPGSSESSPALVEWGPRPPKSRNNSNGGRSSVSKIPTTPIRKSSISSATDACLSASDSRARPEDSGLRSTGAESEISERNVVVSTTDVPGSSVTVSVICPEVSSKARTIFWKNNIPLREKVGQLPHSNYSDECEHPVIDDLRPEAAGSDIRNEETEGRVNNTQSGRQMRDKNYENLGAPLNAVGALRENIEANSTRDTGRYHRLLGDEDHLVRSVVGSSQKVSDNQPPINMKAAARGRTDQSELIGNVIGVVKEIPAGKVRLSKDCDPTERLGSVSMTNGRNETKNIPSSMGDSIRNPFSVGLHQIIPRANRVTNGISEGNVDVDYSELSELLKEFSAIKENSKPTEIPGRVEEMTDKELNKVANDGNFPQDLIQRSGQKREMDMIRYMMSRNKDSSTHDLLWFKLYQKLLRSVGQAGQNRHLEILREFGALVSESSSANRRNDDNEPESSDCSYPAESDQGMEVDEDTNAENGYGKSTVRRASSMAPNVAGDQIQRDIKIEAEIEPEAFDAGQNPLNENSQDNRAMNSMNSMHCLVQAKLQCAKSELDHQMKLQKLEVEEKELRVKIAEMTIQETRLRIQALVEERGRAKEIHDLRLARMAVEKVRSEAEHAARIDASCATTAEARARINSIERDRERSENFYQMQLRCMSASTAIGNCGVKCKQYQN